MAKANFLHKKTYIARCLTLELANPQLAGYNVYKIGSAFEPSVRLYQLERDKLSDYFGEKFHLEAVCPINIEHRLHTKYVYRRLNYGRTLELFFFTPEEVSQIIKDNGFNS